MRFVIAALTTLAVATPALAGPRHFHNGPHAMGGNVAAATNVQVGVVKQTAIARNGSTAFNIGSVSNTGGAVATNNVTSIRY